ncbi:MULTISPECIES: GNAT family N-acetyltransferase [Streptomycetaceae]|uniref:N-acetyltransferase domain-containing protein n=1 Tax=Streptantibioticus cattleyicolor (strain ATCC 35852 / DSM 46488 / JCM 4925 / NBRC 14057 / NRRL 8057) TaxID=1003195 RepID=F8JWF3_STREN|nr:GNAT family N-acetyltransferase [Streptantibioticus cattleyicolor]AEW94529.1 hypothetical protein SCATT_21580 [Streptantibioticus cattleyicolor NRRL 8057 = DSM 46488]MYS59170.1 GNAT family N-acetyltransferase [Streptomyces sp. SID5468]CCB74887.1 conserved protein of unknown function [Streptantibioticus cattleyicolor NRRL 8057 = DSM 46488]
MNPVVTDVPAAHRFEARVGGDLAGFASYLRSAGLIAFVHTEVDPAYEGRGVGSALVRGGLDTARAAGLRVVPVCPFVASWIEGHPGYRELVYENRSRVTD